MHLKFAAASAIAGIMLAASAAQAAPIYIGYSIDGSGITRVVNGVSGSATLTNQSYCNAGNTSCFAVSASAEGTPPLTEPDLLSNSVAVTGEHPGEITLYITETNQFPVGKYFTSLFGIGELAAGDSVVESTYFHDCGVPNTGCNNTSDVFATSTLLSTQTFTATGSVFDTATWPGLGTNDAYAITEVYQITLTHNPGYDDPMQGSIAENIPEPGTVALFGAGLLGFGLLRRRKTKSAA
jgi:hypothetical protein